MTGLASSSIGISITTKDRWDDLEITLSRLKTDGLDCLETIVIDDGSAVPLPSHFKQKFPWVKFIRFESSQGATTQRNRIAQLLSTPLILGLDDDSFPIAGDLEAAASWLMGEPKACSLGFPIINDELPLPPLLSAPKPPFPSKSFVACACLIKREQFLALGGYEELLGYYWEEQEFSLKAFQQGYRNYTFPGVIVRHRVTSAARNHGRQIQLMVRNYMLICLWYHPFPISYFRAVRYGFMRIIKDPLFRKQWNDVLIGTVQGLLYYFSHRKDKKRQNLKQFREWYRLEWW